MRANNSKNRNVSENRNFASAKNSTCASSLLCEFCHMTGHSKDKCFCIHGYPEWHKLYGKPKPKPQNVNS